MSVIANTTIISNFASLEALNLLRLCWPNLHISEQVFTEIQNGLEQGYAFYAGIERILFPLAEDGWLKLTSMQTEAERVQYGKLLGKLHHGEASCLAIAHERNWMFLTDDKAARTAESVCKFPSLARWAVWSGSSSKISFRSMMLKTC